MEPDEKVLALMQQLHASRKERIVRRKKKWEDSERHKRLGKEKMDGMDKERRKDVMRISG